MTLTCVINRVIIMDQDATWYGGRHQPRRHCVRWGRSFPLPKKGTEPTPQLSAHVYCGQTAGWIKTALSMEMGLGPGHIVLDGTQLPSSKRGQSPLPNFGPFLGDCLPFAIRQLSVLSVCPVCQSRWCIFAKRLDRSRCHLV